MSAIIVLTSVPNRKSARLIADKLVKSKLAACVSAQPGIESVYRWKGKLEHSKEIFLIIKTHKDRFKAVEQVIKNRHPYELPEIVSFPVAQGSREYLAWLNHSLN